MKTKIIILYPSDVLIRIIISPDQVFIDNKCKDVSNFAVNTQVQENSWNVIVIIICNN
jgi:hypothetical protein